MRLELERGLPRDAVAEHARLRERAIKPPHRSAVHRCQPTTLYQSTQGLCVGAMPRVRMAASSARAAARRAEEDVSSESKKGERSIVATPRHAESGCTATTPTATAKRADLSFISFFLLSYLVPEFVGECRHCSIMAQEHFCSRSNLDLYHFKSR